MPDHKKKIAVIGSGISGLSAAWLLGSRHDVTVFEADNRPGGHANTVKLDTAKGPVWVDTGFIVYNEKTYPNFTALLAHLNVATAPSDMSFGVSASGGAFEYSGSSLKGLLAQPYNIVRPRFIRMMRDLIRFYKDVGGRDPDDFKKQTLGDYLSLNSYDSPFIDDHIIPMTAAIWSTSHRLSLDFPMSSFLDFCQNHGLVQFKDRPEWRTVPGGSRQYIKALIESDRFDLKLSSRVKAVCRSSAGPQVTFDEGATENFDAVVVAVQGPLAFKLIADPTAQERSILSQFSVSQNRAVLHRDKKFMPKRKAAWSSWNIITGPLNRGSNTGHDKVTLTYWMNKLQPLTDPDPVFVTLNPQTEPEGTIQDFDYIHPLFNNQAYEAQKSLWSLQGEGGIWYAGAHFGYGFHEDGLQSGLAVAEDLGGVKRPFEVKNPRGRIVLSSKSDMKTS